MSGQAEHYVVAVRDHALSLACCNRGLPPAQARSYDDLPAESLVRSEAAHVGTVDPAALRSALGVSVVALIREGLPHALIVAERLAELREEEPPR